MTSSHLVLEALSSPAAVQQLSTLKAAPDTLTKWQQTNAMLVQATLHVIPQIGFTADLPGLQAYTEAFAEQLEVITGPLSTVPAAPHSPRPCHHAVLVMLSASRSRPSKACTMPTVLAHTTLADQTPAVA